MKRWLQWIEWNWWLNLGLIGLQVVVIASRPWSRWIWLNVGAAVFIAILTGLSVRMKMRREAYYKALEAERLERAARAAIMDRAFAPLMRREEECRCDGSGRIWQADPVPRWLTCRCGGAAKQQTQKKEG